jgi:hypothetical protein
MGLLASGQASLLPKEAFDKGWRKVAVLIVGILAMGAIGYALVKAGRFELAAGIAVPIAGLVAAYLKINIKGRKKRVRHENYHNSTGIADAVRFHRQTAADRQRP